MEIITVKCPTCTSIIKVNQTDKQVICGHCHTGLAIGEPETLMPIAPAYVSVHDMRLAHLNQLETNYYHGRMLFDEVLAAYQDAEAEGGPYHDFWLARARFFAKGNIEEFYAGRVLTGNKDAVVGQYIRLMEHAIAAYAGNSLSLKMEKEKTIGEIKNAFGGEERRAENEAMVKAHYEQQRKQEIPSGTEEIVDELEDMEEEAARKKRRIFVLILSVLILGVGFFLLLTNNQDEETPPTLADVRAYERFLNLDFVVGLMANEANRQDILDAGITFTNQNTDTGSLRTSVPSNAQLDRLTFHFDQDDTLTHIVIHNAQIFNQQPSERGITPALFAGADVTAVEETDTAIRGVILGQQLDIILTNDAFSVEISRMAASIPAHTQDMWDLIEGRIEEGFVSWDELHRWAIQNNIPFLFVENGVPPMDAIMSLINRYGVMGSFRQATPIMGMFDDEYEVHLLFHFVNLTYNTLIAELFELNPTSHRELASWLENGRHQLAIHFDEVELLDIDQAGEIIEDLPEDATFISWEIAHVDLFTPVGMGRIRIERHYDVPYEEEEEDDEDEEENEENPTAEPTILESGTWIVGTDIPQGRFAITADSIGGFSVMRHDVLLLNEVLGYGGTGLNSITTYLLAGDEITLNGIDNTTFTPVTERVYSNSLGAGHWVVGLDLPIGDFSVSVPAGAGSLAVSRDGHFIFNEILSDGNQGFGFTRAILHLEEGDLLIISGLNAIIFSEE